MAIKSFTLTEVASPNNGAIFFERIIVQPGTESDIYLLPIQEIYSIAVNFESGLEIYFTNAKAEFIEDDSADWELWDGISEINRAVTALYTNNPEVAVLKADISIKTSKA